MECHTPRNGPQLDMERLGGGGRELPDFANPGRRRSAATSRPTRNPAIGKWSDADVKASILLGIRPDGTKLAHTMPFAEYNGMTSDDLNAIVFYLRS
jgi:hypothetical protein